MYYEVFIPSSDPDGYDVTITVDADNWMFALKSGLERIGEGREDVQQVMCDIKDDDTIHVTDAESERVFIMRRLEDQDLDIDGAAIEKTEPEPDPSSTSPGLGQFIDEPVADDRADSTTTSGSMEVDSSTHEQLQQVDDQPDIVDEERTEADKRTAELETLTKKAADTKKVASDVLEEIFMDSNRIVSGDMEMEQTVRFAVELAMDKMDAESGSVLFVNPDGQTMYFAVARGPKSREVMDYTVPVGEGIAGFCTRQGVSLAVSEVDRDPRHYDSIAEAVDYKPSAMLCSPIQIDGQVFGCIELLNKSGRDGSDTDRRTFAENEMHALTYLGSQLAKYLRRATTEGSKIKGFES